jgi:hypothetical protein
VTLEDDSTPFDSAVTFGTAGAIEGAVTLSNLQGTLSAAKGGTGQSSSSSTGVPRVSSGTWSFNAGVGHLAASTSADLRGVISDETGSGALCFATSPTLVTPSITGLTANRCVRTNASGIVEVAAGDCGSSTADIDAVWTCANGDCSALTAGAGDTLNATAADSSAPCKSGTSAPGTCSVGQCFFDTDASPAGEQLFFCTATDTWTKVGDGGGAGSGYATIEDEGSPLAQETVLNFTGAGITCTAETGETECEVPGGSSITSAAARAYNNAAISISHSTVTALTFNSERFDTNSLHDTGSNTSRLTAPVTGVYMISGSVQFASNATGIRAAFIRLNGSTNIATQILPVASSTDIFTFGVQTIYQLTAGDYVELTVFQNSGGSLNVNSDGNRSPEFAMALFAGQ